MTAVLDALVLALRFYADEQKAVLVVAPVPVHLDEDGRVDYEAQTVDRGDVARAALLDNGFEL